MRCLTILFVFTFSGCLSVPEKSPSNDKILLQPDTFESLPGWGDDELSAFAPAFNKSCERVLNGDPSEKMGALAEAGAFADWQPLCREFMGLQAHQLKSFFENRTMPYLVTSNGGNTGLFTGYFEASLEGARERTGPFQTPLHNRPDDLVTVSLGDFRAELNGDHIAGRVMDGRLLPYETRVQIVGSDDYPHKDDVLVWVDDPIDAFFVQIQGSGVVDLADGGTMRIGYAGQNGHAYYAIGHELMKRGEIAKEDMSMQAIREWLMANPALADDVLNTNDSYVFFREIDAVGPIGAEGVALTPGRSLAIDDSLLSYGVPIWVNMQAPKENSPRIQRLMVAQDTGSAIRGAVRGDVFWGRGDEAEEYAGKMKSSGKYWVLLPKEQSCVENK